MQKTSKGVSSILFDADPTNVAQISEQHPFDVIVIGSGMGGGVLAHALSDAKQRVLLLERGDLLFTTHSLNTTRPRADLTGKTGPTQDNDIVYALMKGKVMVTESSDPWTGGPLYCVGGRSNAWGLYIPRIDQKTLKEYFPPSVVADLLDNEDPKTANYYKRAEYLMHNKSYNKEGIKDEPLDINERLHRQINRLLEDKQVDAEKYKDLLSTLNNKQSEHGIDVKPIANNLREALKDYSLSHHDSVNLADMHWALLGAQWSSKDRYEFPQGAFSSTDRILEAVFRTHKNANYKMQPPYLTVLHNTAVIELVRDGDVVQKVKTITATGQQHSFIGKKVVVCAGTIDSPALLLRSGIQVQFQGTANAYTGVTDHNIYGFRFTLKGGADISPAKLQLEGEVAKPGNNNGAKKVPFLLNICINASSFLSRDFEEAANDSSDGVCTLTYEFRAPINKNNYVALDVYTGQPILHIKNSGEENGEPGKIHPQIGHALSELNIFIEETIRKSVGNTQKSQLREERQVWRAAGLGCVAHEIGTLPLSVDPRHGVVDPNLKFHAARNLYACDMSVLPVSAPANPSLTLVALALRLADHIVATK